MDYRGCDFEEKTLMVGWQITISKNDVFIRHSSITSGLSSALDEARFYVDGLIDAGNKRQ